MKKLLLGIAAVCLAGFTFAQDAPLWMRHSVISPDGTTDNHAIHFVGVAAQSLRQEIFETRAVQSTTHTDDTVLRQAQRLQ